MARFYGEVGYGESVETLPGSGKWEDVIVEVPYFGDVIRTSRDLEPGDGLNSDINVRNSISIIADQQAVEHFVKIKYVRWAGVNWLVPSVESKPPRLILSLGGVYNGPTP